MSKMISSAITAVLFLVLIVVLLVAPASAQNIFENECPDCYGTGQIESETFCRVCNGTGKIFVGNPNNNGTGKTEETVKCYNCLGTGKISVIRCLDSRVTKITVDWNAELVTATVQGVFLNDHVQAVKANVTAVVELLGHPPPFRYEETKEVYLPVRQNVTVGISLFDMSYPENWDAGQYNFGIFVSSSEGNIHEKLMTCPICGGTGERTVEITDYRSVTTSFANCYNCNGTGRIDYAAVCSTCGGSGRVTDWPKVGITSVTGVGALVGASAFIIVKKKRAGRLAGAQQ